MATVNAATNVGIGSFLEFALSIFGAILSFIALTQINEQITSGWVVFGIIGLISSGIGLILNLFCNNPEEEVCPGFNAVSKLISVFSFGISVLSLGETYQKYATGE
jgi:hypothetical protein